MGFDKEVDFLIIGSGAAAMAAGIRAHDLGLETLLVEKGDHYGGSTAMSGGVVWVGNNPHMAGAGIADSDAETLQYLQHITAGEVPTEKLSAYVEGAQRTLAYLEEKAHLEVMPIAKYTDYYPEAPGGKMGARSLEPRPFDGARLGETFKTLHPPAKSALVLGKFMITAAMAQAFIVLRFSSMLTLLGCFLGYLLRRGKRKRLGRDPHLTNGNALVGRLRLGLKDREVPLWLSAPARELLRDEDRVVGAVVERAGETLRVGARRGVLIAAGGFSRNLEMRKTHGPAPAATDWTAANENNTGDGINMGAAVGGALDLMGEAWWTPVTQYPDTRSGWVLVVEKSLPGAIFVNGNGRRFTNESAPYVDVGVAQYRDHAETGCSIPAWMVFDARYRKNYIAGPVGPGKALPDKRLPRKLRKSFLRKADTLDALAEKIEVNAAGLSETIAHYNQMAGAGVDTDYGRGESAADQYYGDPRVRPNPCMAPLTQGPYYAIPVYPGDLGTKGGLVTDTAARVLNAEGAVIPGLFAAGNASASMMGRTYPGAGGTIGPALTFGFLAAEHAAQ